MRSVSRHSVLDLVEAAFQRLAYGPDSLTVDGASVGGGLPAREVPLAEVRSLLLERPSLTLCDAIWRELAARTRRDDDRESWRLAALGVMLPGLRKISVRSAHLSLHDREELDAELVAQFLAELDCADLTADRLPYRMWWSAFRRARTVMLQRAASVRELDGNRDDPGGLDAMAQSDTGHPDLALARMRRQGVISEAEEDLVGRTRLEGESLTCAATRLGISYQACKQRRGRAERRIAQRLGCELLMGAGGGGPHELVA